MVNETRCFDFRRMSNDQKNDFTPFTVNINTGIRSKRNEHYAAGNPFTCELPVHTNRKCKFATSMPWKSGAKMEKVPVFINELMEGTSPN